MGKRKPGNSDETDRQQGWKFAGQFVKIREISGSHRRNSSE